MYLHTYKKQKTVGLFGGYSCLHQYVCINEVFAKSLSEIKMEKKNLE